MMWKIIAGCCLDLIFGDPGWLFHPVQGIGWLISRTEKILRKKFPKTPGYEIFAGGLMTLIVVSITWFVCFSILYIAAKIHQAAAVLLEILMIYQIMAAKCLKTESMKVYDALREGDLEKSRKMISYLVGRDTKNLNEEEIVKAAVETVAENTTDGVIAPLFFIAIGGAPLGMAYKAVNTLDSMVGYRNEKYLYFGRISAKTDDIVNFIPARIAGVLMVFAAFLLRYDGKSAWRIFLRDRNAHLSPNSAQTEAACAGALGIQLGGTHDYFGKPVEKPAIGDNQKKADKENIKDANRMLYMTGFLGICLLIVGFVLKYLICGPGF
jgi:adenosylcobinamide-phosphate synthase